MVDASSAGRLGHPPRGAAGRGDEQRPTPSAAGGGADQPDRRGLAGARAAGDDREPVRERRRTAAPLLGRRARASSAARRAGRFEDGLRRGELARPARRARPRAPRSAAGRPRRRRRRRPRSRARPRPPSRSSSAAAGGGAAEQRAGRARELGDRQAGRAVPLGLGEHVQRRRRAVRAGESAATPPARAIRSAIWKPTPNTLVSSYGRSRTTRCARVAVVLGDPRDEPGEPVRREQQVQRAGRAQAVPRARPPRSCASGSARPRGTPRAGRASIASSTLLAVALEQRAARAGADVLDALEVGEQRGVAGRRERLGRRDLDLHPEAPVVLPDAARSATRSRSSRWASGPTRTISSPSRSASRTAKPVSSLAGEPHPPDDDLVLERRAGRALDHSGRTRRLAPPRSVRSSR